MPDARGDVLCPTCGQWTPPAPFCTECGAALQGDVRDAVGGQGSDVFRRGREVDQPGSPWSSQGERFEPEPEDEAARAAAAARAAGTAPVDHFVEREPEAAPVPASPPAPAPTWPTEPGVAEGAAAAGARPRRPPATPPDERQAPVPPRPTFVPPPTSPPPPPRTYASADSDGGVSGLVFVLFLGLGILALLGGAILGGVFDGAPTAERSPSPEATIEERAEPTPEPTSTPTASPSAAPTAPPPSAAPGEFPDGFIARAEACNEEPSSSSCDNSGAVNDGEVWILVSFRHAKPTDVIGVSIIDSGGDVDGESSLELNFCGESTDCAGYTFFGFDNLAPGGYTVRVTRNGTYAATTSFTVE